MARIENRKIKVVGLGQAALDVVLIGDGVAAGPGHKRHHGSRFQACKRGGKFQIGRIAAPAVFLEIFRAAGDGVLLPVPRFDRIEVDVARQLEQVGVDLHAFAVKVALEI